MRMSGLKTKLERFNAIRQKKSVGDALKTAWNNGIVRPVEERRDFRRHGDRYPHNVLFISGFAKSGSSWLANMVAELPGFRQYVPSRWPLPGEERHSMDIYPGLFDEFNGRLAVVKGHTCGSVENIRRLRDDYGKPFLLGMRDPRDCMISAYWYIRRYRTHWDHEKAVAMELPEYIDYKLESGEFESEFISWMRPWLDHCDRRQTRMVRYEDLLVDPIAEMEAVFKHLDIECSQDEIRGIVEKWSFRNVTGGRSRGEENTGKFVRKGVSQEWKRVFTDRQQVAAAAIARDVLQELGYGN
jgi:hypothetical protein